MIIHLIPILTASSTGKWKLTSEDKLNWDVALGCRPQNTGLTADGGAGGGGVCRKKESAKQISKINDGNRLLLAPSLR